MFSENVSGFHHQVMLNAGVSKYLNCFELTLLDALYDIVMFIGQEDSRYCKLLVLLKFNVFGTSQFAVD
jgi:hypothetical protein